LIILIFAFAAGESMAQWPWYTPYSAAGTITLTNTANSAGRVTGSGSTYGIGTQSVETVAIAHSNESWLTVHFGKLKEAFNNGTNALAQLASAPWTLVGYVTGTPWTEMGYVTGTPWTEMGYVTGTPWTELGFITTWDETDPEAGAVTGIILSDGFGNFSAATIDSVLALGDLGITGVYLNETLCPTNDRVAHIEALTGVTINGEAAQTNLGVATLPGTFLTNNAENATMYSNFRVMDIAAFYALTETNDAIYILK
jgi:hypothetical protein